MKKSNPENKLSFLLNKKKAQALPLNVIIIAVIVLVVLVVLIFIFTGRTQQFQQGLSTCAKCVEDASECADDEAPVYRACRDSDTEKGSICCTKVGS